MYTESINIIKGIVGHEYLYFDTAITLGSESRFSVFRIWGVCVSPTDVIYVMDGSQEWWPVSEKDYTVVASLYTRLEKIAPRYLGTIVSPAVLDNVLIAEPLTAA